jgi:DNA helicase-2/ATP-dependent DNA helicase PcrA
MIEALLERSKNNIKLLMVGDFDQNIYTWRGSDMNNIIDFLDRHPYERRYLKNSYRLSRPVKDLSQRLITSVPGYNSLRDKFYTGY